jgi:citrate lyase subunit beta/citryl-CoA lyase
MVRRTDPEVRNGLPEESSRLRRSELSTPATSLKMIAKAAASDADLVFLDLEDAVAPSEKAAARRNIVTGFTQFDWGSKTRAFRINGVRTSWCHDDLIEVLTGTGGSIDVIIIPKVKAPVDASFVDTLVTQLEIKLGLEEGKIGLEVLIEETQALACVEDIAGSSSRLEALILGVGDLSASQGIRATHIGVSGDNLSESPYPGDLWHYAYNRMIVAARANGVDAIAGPYGNFRDPDGYRRDAIWSATLGAVGKWCIHPSQIEIANEIFAPTRQEIEYATTMIEAMKEAEASGLGAANLDGVLIDAATTRIFGMVLDRARRCGLA